MEYLELDIKLNPVSPWDDIIVSQLAELGFESFTNDKTGVKAYGPTADVNMEEVMAQSILGNVPEGLTLSFTQEVIAEQNWNATWEADFEPVFVEDKLTILAPFHDASIAKGMKVEIQPQMSFGTGHHQTTWLMSKALFAEDLQGKRVLDVGSGTGVLAIVAKKLGAGFTMGTDIEEGAVENAIENQGRNDINDITFLLGDIDVVKEDNFDLLLANINKNVLKAHMPTYAALLKSGGKLKLSGFFESDVDELVTIAAQNGFTKEGVLLKEGWAVIQLIKN
ncbi:ribosomal protein L11 methyltransferase [Lishizhenia tianjinensis]|uniref:Ribosomal protein L11 methyltransferase n=1 Tax=Lishizhenia tianjinensis TaxID=477690 RepID=A0A1I6XKD6_9FLAO|nr:50S ribosomal protein L11 methyltransferase [Lishizhenia tianjinensis]SFT38828.1 ribosomal protein L11 methyltransferase [Lishizhenia tianjinensis]